MTRWRGLTWDHPRGAEALRAAVFEASAPCDLEWDVQPLEGFESASIEDNAAAYDLVVLDHPHVGEAHALGALRPLDELFGADELAAWAAGAVGSSFSSYTWSGHQWALPLDAATQVTALADPGIEVPRTWDEARALAQEVRATLPTSGPHLFLTLCSIAVGNGFEPGAGERFLSTGAVEEALDVLLAFDLPDPCGTVHNPISVLEHMAAGDGPVYCPHVYGYVNYSRPGRERLIRFVDAPVGRSGRIGSVLGGTGLAVSRRCDVTVELLDHLRWLMSDAAQSRFVPQHAGQPSMAVAWESDDVNAASADFYRGTRRTTEDAWVRPRHDGAVAFQVAAADAVRESLFGDGDATRLARRLDDLHAQHLGVPA